MNYIATLASYFFLCILKFMFAPIAAYTLYDFSYLETLSFTAINGVIIVLLFAFLSTRILIVWDKIKAYIPFLNSKKPKQVFTKQNRTFVKIKMKYGFWGLIVIAPLFPSIPIGTFLAVRFFGAYGSTIFFMSLSVVAWAVINCSLYYYLFKML